jgi:hypothetical protein
VSLGSIEALNSICDLTNVEEGVAVPELDVSAFASGDLHALTVLDQKGAGEVVSAGSVLPE